MTKINYSILETNISKTGELLEISTIIVDAITYEIISVFYTKINDNTNVNAFTGTKISTKEALLFLQKIIQNTIMVSHISLSKDKSFLNKLYKQHFGINNCFKNPNIVDLRFLAEQVLEYKKYSDIKILSKELNIIPNTDININKVYTSYLIFVELMKSKTGRHNVYKKAFQPININIPTKTSITVETTVKTTKEEQQW